jgi:4-alpha-glucanotransferase
MLPVGPIGAGDSPYQSPSTFAGNPLLIDLHALERSEWLDARDLNGSPADDADARAVDYDAVRSWKEERLRRAGARFHESATSEQRDAIARFAEEQQHWLADYALYQTLREIHGSPWTIWPDALRERDPTALAQARSVHADAIAGHVFEQWIFDCQWRALRDHCATLGIGLIGDVPIYVSHDSAEVWANRELFSLDRGGEPAAVAGVPSDYFSEKGQRWDNPLYDWERHAADDFAWWRRRLDAVLARFDAVRLDHFIGFERYWAVPATAPDARSGRWRKGPGARLFKLLSPETLPRLIAEDLGATTPAVHALRDRFDLPGMRVLQFGFTGERGASPHLPHNYPNRCVAYSTTHDYDTLVGWLHGSPDGRPSEESFRRSRRFALDYVCAEPEEFHRAALRVLWLSPAALVVAPLQDVLGLGGSARMNRPGTPGGNWRWRFAEHDLGPDTAEWLRSLTHLYGRSPADLPE